MHPTTLSVIIAILALACPTHAAEPVAAKDVAFEFANPPVAPEPDVPREARNTNQRPVPGKIGPLSDVIAGRIAAITVTWSAPALFAKPRETEDFLRSLLKSTTGSAYPHIPWAQSLGVPSVAATVRHTEGKNGRWLVWYAWPSVYCAYQDGTGRWWFGAWFEDKDVRLPERKGGLQ